MPKYPNPADEFDRARKRKQARTMAGLLGSFLLFFGCVYWVTAGTEPAPVVTEQSAPSLVPEELMPPPQTELAAISEPVEFEPAPAPPVQPVKKMNNKKKTKKIAKNKSSKKDALVCIPPSRLKALERQVARASRR